MPIKKNKKHEEVGISKTTKILLVDSDLNYKKILEKKLDEAVNPYELLSVNNNEKFFNSLKEFNPDIVISEFKSSTVNGLEILKYVQKHLPGVQTIIIATEEKEKEALRCFEKGAFDFINRGFLKKIIFVINKIIKEKGLEIELQESKLKLNEAEKDLKRFKKLEQNFPGMCYQFVLHPDRKYAFSYVGSSSKEMFGLEQADMINNVQKAINLMHPDDVGVTKKAIGLSAITLKSFKREARFLINGETKWYRFISYPEMEENGDIIWYGLIMDNTENKLLELEHAEERDQIHKLVAAMQDYIKDSNDLPDEIRSNLGYNSTFLADSFFDQNQFKILMDNMPDAIYFKDTESKFIRVNRHHVMKLGEFTERNIIGKTDFDFYNREQAEEYRRDELSIIATGDPVINKVQKEKWPSGKITWSSTTKMPLRDSKNNIVGTFGMSRDITNIKRMEKTIADERNLLHKIIDAIPERIYVRDKDGKFVLNNLADLKALGINSQFDILNKQNIIPRTKDLYVQSFNEDIEVIQTGKSVINKEVKIETSEGDERWYLTTKVPLRDTNDDITGLVGISNEITLQKKIESKLIASQNQLTEALKIAKLAYWEYDINNDVFTFNDQFYSLLKTNIEKEGSYQMTSTQYASTFVHPEDRPLVGIEVQKSLNTKDPNYFSHLEHRIIYSDGEIGYFSVHINVVKDAEAQTVRTYGANQDITQRRLVEEALRASEYLLKKSQYVAHLGSYSLDIKTGIWECSETVNEIFGIDETYVKTFNSLIDIFHPEEQEKMIEFFKEDVIKKNMRFEKEYRIIRKNDGEVRWVLGLGDIEFDSNGKPLRLIGTIQDITERVLREKEKLELEKELKERNKKLEQALFNVKQMQNTLVQSEKMASLGQLTAGIAHEINNPLAYVSSNVNRLNEYFFDTIDLLNKWRDLGGKLKNTKQFADEIESIDRFSDEIDLNFILEDFNPMIKSISEGTGRIKKIVEGLRGFAHMSGTSFLKSSINDAIDDTLTIVWNVLKYKTTIKKDYGELPQVSCNIGEIKQVLVNLLVNAAHSINEKGDINISTYQEGESVCIKIKDTGCGISQENLKRIFDPFFTTKPVGKGTGLGLWISSSIIEKHAGLLTVDSKVGEGSSFTIKLPIEQKVAESEIKET